jgi:energy-coupling factor transporter ATP-binding protein EcfA2
MDSPIGSLKNDITNTSSISKVLFSGHRGSGKTTELHNLKNILEKQGFLVVFVAATKDMNIYDLYYTDVLLTLIKNTVEFVSSKVRLNKKQSKKLEELLKDLQATL